MSDCSKCVYDYFRWCEKRPIENGTHCRGCNMFDDGCICSVYSVWDECPYFIEAEDERDEMDRD